jgi:hypothetical protein
MAKRQEPEGFETFWLIWRPHARHTDGRGLARDTFAKHVKNGADAQDIVDGAKCFFRTMKDRDRDYVPLAATWLNRMSFEDLAEQERVYEAKVAERKARMETALVTPEVKDENTRARVRELTQAALNNMRAPT